MPQGPSVVSNEQGLVTYTRTSSRNGSPYGLRVVSNEQGHIVFELRRSRKTNGLRLRMRSWYIGSLIGMFLEPVDIMKLINILVLQDKMG